MNKETILVAVVALLAGLIVGYMFWQKSSQSGPEVVKAPPGSPAMINNQQRINQILAAVTQDPQNRQAWVMLGNEYFDADRPVESIEAYQKALDLNPNDPNVLTDQGVMYRRIRQFERALDNFNKATQIDPRHINSLFNIGVVYRYDLNKPDLAEAAWSKFLTINPSGPGADRVRQELSMMKNQPPFTKP
jgi:cytochrome c-type biogenesis protein CcmH/NrfG